MNKRIRSTIGFLFTLLLVLFISACTTTDDVKDEIDSSNENESNNGENNEANENLDISSGYLYFGSYPQSEIVSALTDSGVYEKEWATDSDCIVDEALYNTLKELDDTKWDSFGDTTINNNKYRRIKSSDAIHKSTTDDEDYNNHYNWESDDTYHYFKYEPIKWRVLKQNDDSLFLLSEIIIDDQPYNTIITNLTWETSTIRSWLNGYDSSCNLYGTDYSTNNFLNTAFSSIEISKILNTNVVNNDSIKSGIEGGNDTVDKIFLLSEDEIYGTVAATYGFNEDYNNRDTKRQAKSSTYAKARGVYADCDSDYLGNCDWWLRSPGSHIGLYELIYCNGKVYRGGQHANSKTRGVRPAIYISY